jgi:hypothetical protein
LLHPAFADQGREGDLLGNFYLYLKGLTRPTR